MWNEGNLCTLLDGMQTSTAIVETAAEVFQKTKNKSTK